MSPGCVHTWANGTQAMHTLLVGIILGRPKNKLFPSKSGQIFGLAQGQRQRRFLGDRYSDTGEEEGGGGLTVLTPQLGDPNMS